MTPPPEPTIRHLRIAGHAFGLAADAEGTAAVEPALAHLYTDEVVPPDAPTWRVWASEDRHPLWDDAPPGPGRLADGGLVVSRPDPPIVEVARPDGSIELWGEPGALAGGDIRAHPASTALAHVLAGRDTPVLHAGAVVWADRAALVLGPSGAGKSTTVLACVAAGADYLGDDLCALTPGDRPTVHGLYGTAKLTPETEAAIGTPGPTLGHTPKAKRVVALPCTVTSAPVTALVVLGAPGARVGGPRPIGARDALRALTSTALKAGLGAGSLEGWLRAATGLARQVPAFAVTPTWDLDRVAADVRQALLGAEPSLVPEGPR